MLTRPTLDRTREVFSTSWKAAAACVVPLSSISLPVRVLGAGSAEPRCGVGRLIDHYTQQLIRQNATLCGFADCVEVLRLNSAKALARLQGRKFDYIFADPPYNKNLVNDTIALIGEYDLLAPGGLILMEYSRNEGITESPLYEVIREKSYGKDTRIAFIRRRQEGV